MPDVTEAKILEAKILEAKILEAKILIMATDGFEQSELMVPLEKLRAAGAVVKIAAPSKTRQTGEITGWDKADWGKSVPTDMTIDDVRIAEYDALVLPGGVMNPDKLRLEPAAVRLVKEFVASGKPVAAICHAPWLLVEAGVAKGRRLTSYGSIKTDMRNAGADWQDEEAVNDDGIITSRSPDDLDAFVAAIIEELGSARPQERRAA